SGDFVAKVHHAFADVGADAGFFHRLADGVGVVHGAHVEDRGGAAEHKFGQANAGADAEFLECERGFVGPDALFEPVDQHHVVGVVAHQGLAEVNVRLHKSGNDDVSGGVDLARACGLLFRNFTDGGDFSILHENIAGNDIKGGVH